jgi:type IV pilus assembly protein PilX
MSFTSASSRRAPHGLRVRSQRGVVLFIALLVMVALSLAGIALLRSADTATTVAGNLAFKQSAAAAVDRSVEQAVEALFNPKADPTTSNPVIADKTTNDLAQNYYACVQAAAGGVCLPPGNPIPESPTALTSTTALSAAGLRTDLVPTDAAGNKVYYVIERMCANPGGAFGNNCNLSSAALGADAGTQHYEALSRVGDAYYRVTVRVEGPRNTVQYAQAFLK